MLFIIVIVLLALFFQYLDLREGPDKIEYRLSLDRKFAECGDTFHLKTTLQNRSGRPVLFGKLIESVDEALLLFQGEKSLPAGLIRISGEALYTGKDHLEEEFYLLPGQKYERILTASFSKRGRYIFNTAKVMTGDFLGFVTKEKYFSFYQQIIILPKRCEIPGIDTIFGNYLGDLSVRRFILTDPILTVGFREYTGREPMKAISWKRSMRENRLMVREYDHTAEPRTALLLNLEGADPEEAETLISMARTAAEYLEQKRVSFSFCTNAVIVSPTGVWNYIPDGVGREHTETILTGLGCMLPMTNRSFSWLFCDGLQDAGEDGLLGGAILITPVLTLQQSAHVRRFETEGSRKVLVLTGEGRKEKACC